MVENRAGGGGVPGVMAVKEAPPDGYTLLMGSSGTLGVNPGLYAKLPYDPLRDFAPASNVFLAPQVLVANPGFRAEDDPGAGRGGEKGARQDQLRVGRSRDRAAHGRRSSSSCARASISSMSPTKAAGPAMTDVIGGQVPIMLDAVASALPHIRSGKVRPIAVTAAARVPQLPDVPTIAESGYPGFEGVGWSGIQLPAGTPREIVERVSADIQKVLADPQFRERIVERGAIPDPRTPQALHRVHPRGDREVERRREGGQREARLRNR